MAISVRRIVSDQIVVYQSMMILSLIVLFTMMDVMIVFVEMRELLVRSVLVFGREHHGALSVRGGILLIMVDVSNNKIPVSLKADMLEGARLW